MPFKFHPPTRTHCEVCEVIANKYKKPLIDYSNGRASSADLFPFHNWYNFVLGYAPKFPDYIMDREKISPGLLIMDPFMGSGTTNICAKQRGIDSIGIDANDFFYFAAKTKLNWDINVNTTKLISDKILYSLRKEIDKFYWPGDEKDLLSITGLKKDHVQFAEQNRIDVLPKRYISDAPFAKLVLLKNVIKTYNFPDEAQKNLFYLAFASIALQASNITYGPGFGVKKAKIDSDVYSIFKKKIIRMIDDLGGAKEKYKKTFSLTHLGDARVMSRYVRKNTVDLIITSPPYPGDHEYTKHSKIELAFMEFATNLDEFRTIKKRMLRGSTTNIYKDDNEGDLVKQLKSIQDITDEIAKRIKDDNGTSGFEKLYTKLVWEYFGGMYKVFKEANEILKPGSKFVLLVSDSHAFKMVHIKTAELLAEVAELAGLVNPHIELWQNKISTSHKYNLFEEILTIEKKKV